MSGARLANLVIAGVPKAGTSSLFAYLAQHPDICASDVKETGFFNSFHPRRAKGPIPSLDIYARHFAHCSDQRYLLEATPDYSYGGRPIIMAMKEILKTPKVMILLRDPVERLWSAYTFQRALGNLAGIPSFEHYLDVLTRRPRDGSDLIPGDHLHGLYIGYYADYIGDWLDAFGDDLRIIFTENLRARPVEVLGSLCAWLGVDPDAVGSLDLRTRNVTRHPRSTRVARAVHSVKRRSDQLGLVPSEARERFRRLYQRLNTGEMPERLEPALRRQVEHLYRNSTEQTAQILAQHGYRDVPAWLRVNSPA